MTVREQIVKIIQEEGYDTVTACELADKAIAETPAGKAIDWIVGKTTFTLQRA